MRKRTRILFTCKCGKTHTVRPKAIPKNCRKCHNTARGKSAIKHGKSKTSEYMAWMKIKQMCNNENHPQYEVCAERNIKVCDEWFGENGFINFYKDMGDRPIAKPKLILGRLDYSEGFTPENCKWMSIKESNNNQNKNLALTRAKKVLDHGWSTSKNDKSTL